MTSIALIRLLTGVDAPVCFQVILCGKAFITLTALKRLLIGVEQQVLFQCGSSRKYFSTDLAVVFFTTGVAVDISVRQRVTDFPVA